MLQFARVYIQHSAWYYLAKSWFQKQSKTFLPFLPGHFLFFPSTDRTAANHNAQLFSPYLPSTKGTCLRFWFYKPSSCKNHLVWMYAACFTFGIFLHSQSFFVCMQRTVSWGCGGWLEVVSISSLWWLKWQDFGNALRSTSLLLWNIRSDSQDV